MAKKKRARRIRARQALKNRKGINKRGVAGKRGKAAKRGKLKARGTKAVKKDLTKMVHQQLRQAQRDFVAILKTWLK